MEFSNDYKPTVKHIKKESCKRFGYKDKSNCCILYNKDGIQLFDEDIDFIKADDVLYIALDGKIIKLPKGSLGVFFECIFVILLLRCC